MHRRHQRHQPRQPPARQDHQRPGLGQGIVRARQTRRRRDASPRGVVPAAQSCPWTMEVTATPRAVSELCRPARHRTPVALTVQHGWRRFLRLWSQLLPTAASTPDTRWTFHPPRPAMSASLVQQLGTVLAKPHSPGRRPAPPSPAVAPPADDTRSGGGPSAFAPGLPLLSAGRWTCPSPACLPR